MSTEDGNTRTGSRKAPASYIGDQERYPDVLGIGLIVGGNDGLKLHVEDVVEHQYTPALLECLHWRPLVSNCWSYSEEGAWFNLLRSSVQTGLEKGKIGGDPRSFSPCGGRQIRYLMNRKRPQHSSWCISRPFLCPYNNQSTVSAVGMVSDPSGNAIAALTVVRSTMDSDIGILRENSSEM